MENVQLKLASEFVRYTNKNVFLTGKAGTGKTTFLHSLKQGAAKRMIVVAPTGVAAINAGGVTIHSFFQMPFGPILPTYLKPDAPEFGDDDNTGKISLHKFAKEKINIIRSIDLLVIDEISMVRADLLDGIDQVLRRFRNKTRPFGGVQLLMIGDLQQLTPVVKDDEWALLKPYYDTVYFFSSLALRQTELVSIELKHIYRQNDARFIDILNQVRENKLSKEALDELNKRYIPNYTPTSDEGCIMLTTHNNQARSVNERELAAISADSHVFEAAVDGDFPEMSYPTEKSLVLKVGAQVMFVKNDASREKLFYNGKIGKVVDIDEDDVVWVQCPSDDDAIAVHRLSWDNTKYTLNKETDTIDEKIVGTFEQYPLKLAWAITIHKSQGLTFEHAIIDATSAFASGQVYVALSRCKSLAGLVLSSPLKSANVITDSTVDVFSQRIEENEPDEHLLKQSKIEYQRQMLLDLFSFDTVMRGLNYMRKIISEHIESIPVVIQTSIPEFRSAFESDVANIGARFKAQIVQMSSQIDDIEGNAALQDRLKKGAAYFAEKLRSTKTDSINHLNLDIDNKAVKKQFASALERIVDDLRVKLACMDSVANGYVAKDFLEVRAKSAIEKDQPKKEKPRVVADESIQNSPLYFALKNWRNLKAEELNVPHYQIFTQKALFDLLEKLPTSMEKLQKVTGFGKKKVSQFGAEIIDIVCDYYDEVGIKYEKSYSLDIDDPKPAKVKGETYIKTLELFSDGKSIDEISRIRGLAQSTIESHFAKLIGEGKIEDIDFIDSKKQKAIQGYVESSNSHNAAEIKEALGSVCSYGEIRIVLAWLEMQQ